MVEWLVYCHSLQEVIANNANLYQYREYKIMFIKDLKEFNLPKAEEKVLDYWKTNQVFEKSLSARKKGRKFVFFEGPPTANGRPGIHHVLARAFKDVVLRYKTMRGYYVPRRAGWDTHGLPVEIAVEKELGLKSKKDIEKFGIAEFNKKCRESVWKHKDEWEQLTERMGFWLDMKDPYVTYEKDYIETLWWIVSQMAKRKLLYKGHKIVNWCPRCGTGLSSHEMAQGYKTVTDEAVTVKFQIINNKSHISFKLKILTKKPVYILSWTTTPWTLPGNVALAVGEKINYAFVESGNEILVLAKDRIPALGVSGTIIKEVKGKELVGLSYQPLFQVAPLVSKNSYKIYGADFVTTTDGTGVVHTAVMYGEDDYKLGVKVGLPQHHTVDEFGKFTKDVKGFEGLSVVRGTEEGKKTEKKIFDYLKKNNNLLKIESYKHDYPHCWRCSTSLLYYARSSWFVAMAKLKKELLKNNETINWIPEHVKNGRFGEWLKDVKDWNFSRERYWGTPLPIWECKKCGATETIESLEDLSKKAVSRNNFFFIRHGEADNIVNKICGPYDTKTYTAHLTEKGRLRVQQTAKQIKKEKIDLIISSPLARARETAEIVSEQTSAKIIFEKRFIEIDTGIYRNGPEKNWQKYVEEAHGSFDQAPPKGESLNDVKKRVANALTDFDKKYRGKNILVVSHGDALWMTKSALEGMTDQETLSSPYPIPGEVYSILWKGIPKNQEGLADLHRPYVDEVVLKCTKCKGEMRRVKELADVWFDSGAMPFAQGHWPFAQSAKRKAQSAKDHDLRLATRDLPYPADYIAEAVDQTRGWFYTLLAVATALGKGAPYKNVICLGHINDKFGAKMSKSKGNIVDPWMMAEKYGMDAVRGYMYSATPPGEPKNFDEIELVKTYRRFHLILWNSLVFYRTYAVKNLQFSISNFQPKNVLDQWILARLQETKNKATKSFDRYQIREVALEIEKLTDDLSRWYIRRSRRRLQKSENKKDYEDCSQTLRYVLSEILKMMAPFNPFFSEILWNALGEKDSIHLQEWPAINLKFKNQNAKLLKEMEEVRKLATLSLAKRAEAGIKVRQPLAALRVATNNNKKITKNKQLLEILADEVNVKKVVFDKKLNPPAGGEIELDTNITSELKEEGLVRDLVRAIQELRQKAGLSANDRIIGMFELPESLREIVLKNEGLLKKEVGAKEILYKKSEKFEAVAEIKIESENVWVAIRRL